ncbi:MAG: DUF4347 domain-containing protein [Pseudomonadales bacterium]
MQDRDDLDAIHIISHGSDGSVQLGNTALDAHSLEQNNHDIALWANSFAETGDILVYGCNLAGSEVGQSLINSLSDLTLTDVAASDDRTGHESLGGDWDLEYQAGEIEASVAPSGELQARYEHILAVINGTAGDDVLTGTAAADIISADAGNDTLDGGGGSDQLLGEAGDDVFEFTVAQNGDVYTVDGGTESDTIDLSSYAASAATFGDGTMTIDMGGGQSFQVDYSNIESIVFSDITATVLSANMTQAGFSGTGVWIDGAEAFKVDVGGAGTLDLAYNVSSDTFSVTGSTGVDATSSLAITDLNGTDLVVDQIIIDDDFGDLTTNTGVGNIGLAGLSSDIHGTFTIGGVLGSINLYALAGTLDVQGDAGTIHIANDLEDGALLNVTGDVTTLQVDDDIGGTVVIGGDVTTFDLTGLDEGGSKVQATGNVTVTGNVTSLHLQDDMLGSFVIGGNATTVVIDADVNGSLFTIGGNVGTFTAQSLVSDLTISGDVDSVTLASVAPTANFSAAQVVGTLVLDVGGTDHGDTYISPVVYVFDGVSQTATTALTSSAQTLWMTTEEDVASPSGANGLDSWSGGSVLSFEDPNLAYGAGSTDGTLNNVLNLDLFVQDGDSRIDATHYVGTAMTVGSNSVALQAGDILLSSVFPETLVNSDTSTLSVTSRDVFIFRPDSLTNYSLGGTFIKLIDGADMSVEIEGITLVEQTTTVGVGGGATVLDAGDFLFTDRDNDSTIYRLQPGVLGDGATNSGTVTVLVDGTDLGINQTIHGVELVESNVVVGDRVLTSGQLLISLYADDVVAGTSVSRSDIFVLNVTDTGSATIATAEAFFTGGDIGFDTWQESPWAVSLVPTNADPVFTSSNTFNVAENTTAVGTVVTSDADGGAPQYTLVGAADDILFNIDVNTGVLSFIAAPDFEAPVDIGGNNVYNLTVQVDDGNGGIATQNIDVTVTNVLELVVTTTNATGTGSLHQAIMDANANVGVTDTITFNIGGGGPQTISVDSAGLPLITDSVVLDATTQPGYSGTPLITLDGAATPPASGINGITIRANDSTVKGFIVINFADEGIEIDGSTGFGDNNTIQNNWVGIDKDGNLAGVAEHGIMVSVDATGNLIGGTGANEGNVVGGNGFSGIILRQNADNNIVEGNIVGLKADGITPAGNGQHGIVVETSSDNNRIGGTAAGAGNTISGNTQYGIQLNGATDVTYTTAITGTLIQGNYIGTDSSGTVARGNGNAGIFVEDGATNNTIGGAVANAGNVISGNTDGIFLRDAATTGNLIQGNLIGTDVSGTADLGNSDRGIQIESGASFNTIGGTTAAARNVISGNDNDGIIIADFDGFGTTGNVIQGNHIGTDITGTVALGNSGHGVHITTPDNNTIGGAEAGAGNLIAFNNWSGILVQNSSAAGNAILGNAIHSQGGLGIDLGDDGVTSNDLGDGDTGSNNLQNFPLITNASTDGATTITVSGNFGSQPSTTYRIEFFASSSQDGTGHGEAERYLGFVTVTTDGSGNATFNQALGATVGVGEYVTATATVDLGGGNYGDTSEFAANVIAISSNTAPTTSGIADIVLNEDPGFSFLDLNAVFADAEDPDSALTYTITGNTNPALFDSSSINGSGTLTLDYAADQNGFSDLTIRATDTGGLFVETTFTVTLNAVNDEPIRSAGSVSDLVVAEDSGFTSLGLGSVTYAPGGGADESGQTLTYEVTVIPDSSFFGKIYLADGITQVGTGFYSLAQIQGMQFAPEPDVNGGPSFFTFRITDSGGTANGGDNVLTETIQLDITPVNDDPTVTSSATFMVAENSTSVGTVTSSDIDGGAAQYTLIGGADDGLFSIDINTGALTFDSAPDFEVPADIGGDNVYDITVQVDDGNGGVVNQSISVVVTDLADGIRVTPLSSVALGDEVLVNTTTTDNQHLSANTNRSVATDANGNYVIVWDSYNQDGDAFGVYMQRFAADGTPLGTETLVNAVTASEQLQSSVAMDDAGNFVVTWASYNQDGDGYGIFAQRYDAAGNPLGGEVQVNTYITNTQIGPTIAMSGDGRYVISWSSTNQDGSGSGIYAQVYDANGIAQGGEFLVNTYTGGNQQIASMAMDDAGNFVVAWISDGQDGSGFGIYAQRFDADGNQLGGEFLVNTTTDNSQSYPSVAMAPDGEFVIVWQSRLAGNTTYDVNFQRYAEDGTPIGGETQVVSASATAQPIPAVDMDASGNFTIVWNRYDAGTGYDVMARQYDAQGNALGSEFVAHADSTGNQLYADVAVADNGQFVLAWGGEGAGDANGIYARRFGLVTDEAGGTATFQISLEAAPTADVTIPVSVSDGSEGSVSVGSVTFTTGNWNTPQVITVTGLQDYVNDGDQTYSIILGAAISSDASFSGLDVPDLRVTNVEVPNTAPVNSVPGAQVTDEDTALVFSSGNGNALAVSDTDAGSNALEVTLTVTNGALSLAGVTGLTFSNGDGSADTTMTFTGTTAAINTALDGLTFDPTGDFAGAAQLTISTSDLGNSGTGGALVDVDVVNINVTQVNDAPVVSTTGGSISYVEQTIPIQIDPGLTLLDPDGFDGANPSDQFVGVVQITGNYDLGDILAFTNTSNIQGVVSGDTLTLSVIGGQTATTAEFEAALRSVTFFNGSDTPSELDRTVSFSFDDGVDSSNVATRVVQVSAVNDAPTFTSTAVIGATEDSPYTYLITTNDPDGDAVSITDVTLPGWLTLIDNGDGTATLSGTPGNSEVGPHNIELQVSDGSLSASQNFTLTVANTNDDPVFTSANAFNVSENSAAVGTVTTTDIDGGAPQYTLVGAADDGLFNIDINTGALSFNAAPDFESPADGGGDNIYDITV